MSLNFVSSAVLSSTDGVSHNEERPIESVEALSLRNNRSTGKPLFEQIQYNRDRDKEQYEEISKAMRGTRTLDDEDCAHLDSVSEVRKDREHRIQRSIEDEVAEFKAARDLLAQPSFAEISTSVEVNVSSRKDEDFLLVHRKHTQQQRIGNSELQYSASLQPTIVVVRKKRRRNPEMTSSQNTISTKICLETKNLGKRVDPKTKNSRTPVQTESSNGLGALLCCYESDDESG